MNRKTIAKDYLALTDLWETTDKSIMNYNMKLLFAGCSPSARIDVLSEISGVSRDTVKAWENGGRRNVKIPLIKLCKISEELGIDVVWFMEEDHREGNE